MKYLIYIVVLFISQDSNSCRTIQTGRFTNKARDTKITRTASYQTEVSENEKLHWIWKTKWLNDCEYYMILEKDISANPFTIFKLGDTIHVRVIKVYKETYDWEAKYKGKLFNGFNYILQ